MTPNQWVRATREQYEAMAVAQEGCCAICRTETDRGLFVDYDHSSGKVRGLLCDKCNRGIGLMQESPSALRAAAAYLEAHRG